jgi:hypothetical protein
MVHERPEHSYFEQRIICFTSQLTILEMANSGSAQRSARLQITQPLAPGNQLTNPDKPKNILLISNDLQKFAKIFFSLRRDFLALNNLNFSHKSLCSNCLPPNAFSDPASIYMETQIFSRRARRAAINNPNMIQAK